MEAIKDELKTLDDCYANIEISYLRQKLRNTNELPSWRPTCASRSTTLSYGGSPSASTFLFPTKPIDAEYGSGSGLRKLRSRRNWISISSRASQAQRRQ